MNINNKKILDSLSLNLKMMHLVQENPFKIKAIEKAINQLENTSIDLTLLDKNELEKIPGIGKSIAAKIMELKLADDFQENIDYLKKIPDGVLQLFSIKGIGPKKIKALWEKLNIESPGELLYACNENRLVGLKGFGEKTQDQIKKNVSYYLASSNKLLFPEAIVVADGIITAIQKKYPNSKNSTSGSLNRFLEIIEEITIVTTCSEEEISNMQLDEYSVKISFIYANEDSLNYYLFINSCSKSHLKLIGAPTISSFKSESDFYQSKGLPIIPVELREGLSEIEFAKDGGIPKLIHKSDIKGLFHIHSNYSDGINTIEELTLSCQQMGFEYLGITDHSKSAFYANGLSIERVISQQEKIKKLNLQNNNFYIFSGIESDILNDGSLDYPEDVLKTFDFIIASVHSNLKMDLEKANKRLITAIENPYTNILGHLTGRLLLSREGYPINHKYIIDACAENNVMIELNSNPIRLDIDWRWIDYCTNKNVRIVIAPDAHDIDGLFDFEYGVKMGRKGMLIKEHCLNCYYTNEVKAIFKKDKS